MKSQIRMGWWVAVLAVLMLAGCQNDGSSGPGVDTHAPQVSSITPVNGATNVAVNTAVNAAFSEALNAATVNAAAFTLTGAGGSVAGTVGYSGTTASFTPATNLDYSSSYTATVTTAVKDAAGNSLAADYSWSFTTGVAPDSTPPQVSSTSPASSATSVAVNSAANATFSEALNAGTVSASSFTLTGPGGAVAGAVGYSGFTATFTPSANLNFSSSYTATVSTAVQDLAGNALASSYSWSFTTGPAPDTTAPTVSNVNPSNNATGVLVNSGVSATFSEAMTPGTITAASVTLEKVGLITNTAITGTVNYVGTTATFTPSANLDYDSTYTATITTAAKDLAGNPLAANYVWSFATGPAPDTTPPQVSSTTPAGSATGIAINSALSATFSEALTPATVSTASFTLDQGGTPVSGTVGYSGTTATFTPSASLAYATAYTATLTTAVQDLAGNALASTYTWNFTTGPAPDTTAPTVTATSPVDSATAVSVGSTITADFSEALNAATVTTASFTLDYAGTPVSGTVGYSGTTATFTPAAALAYSTLYTATLTTALQDLAGNALAASSAWTFTTGPAPDTTAPTISGVSPADGATAIEPNSTVTAAFSETMNGTTLTTGSFTVSGPGGAVAGSVGYSGLTASFSPTNALETNTSFTATVTTGAQDAAGNGLAASYAWGFTTRPWTRQLGTATNDFGTSVATDASGNVYVAGYTLGGLDGNTSAGSIDLFVVKYDSSGVNQWTRQLGTAAEDFGMGVATDASGNVYVTGNTNGGLDGNTNAGGFGTIDLFVVKYDSSGVKQWTRQLGTAADDAGVGVATDTSGNVYVTGYTYGGLDGNSSAGLQDLFIVKYDSTGMKQWTHQLGTATYETGLGVATDAGGNVYVTGYTTGGLDGNSNAGSNDLFVVKYDSTGVKQWTRQLGSTAADNGQSVATDDAGNVYVAGFTAGGLDGNTNAGSKDLFVVRYDSTGVKQWTRQLGTAADDAGVGVATDTSGNVYVAGYTLGGLDGNTSAGSYDLFVVKYASTGVKQWTRQFGTTVADIGKGVATDASGNVYVTGDTGGGLDGNTYAGMGDLFVVKYAADGTKR